MPSSGSALAGIGELPAHQHHQREAEEQEQQARDRVLDADYLVVDREDVLAPEAQLLVVGFVGGVRLGSGDSCVLAHAAVLRMVYFAADANLKSWVLCRWRPR